MTSRPHILLTNGSRSTAMFAKIYHIVYMKECILQKSMNTENSYFFLSARSEVGGLKSTPPGVYKKIEVGGSSKVGGGVEPPQPPRQF